MKGLSMRALHVTVVVGLAVAAAVVAPLASASAATATGQIVFGGYNDGWDIYTVRPDGSQLTPLHVRGPGGVSPAFSPDGSRIAFATATQRGRIWTMNADGTRQRRLFDDPGFNDDTPDFLPNGDIVFTRCAGEACAIATVHGDGTGLQLLTPLVDDVIDYYPTASSTGRIAFTRYNADGLQAQVFVIDPGQPARPVTPARVGAVRPDWSPDGRRIVFNDCCRTNTDLYTISANGTGLTRLTTTPYPYGKDQPAYSPAGTEIAFTSNLGHPDNCCRDLWVMQQDGTDAARVATGFAVIYGTDWGPLAS